ncbi:MAG: hypothetical protein JWM10_3208 [Myxococcaceae bacterium]|nr:hypothetical protein [Myxococcaceae bacterium]
MNPPTQLRRIDVPPRVDEGQPPRSTLVHLPAFGAHPATAHVLDRASALAVNAALAAERPLLVRGEPGTGKSQLARAAAQLLGRRFLPFTVDSRTETRDLLYSVDAVSRLARAQLAGSLGRGSENALDQIDVMRFVQPGPLWWAYDWASASEQAKVAQMPPPPTADDPNVEGVVLLVDEIDKADPSVPNGLLDAFGHGRFDVEGRVVVTAAKPRPLVIITTNEDRALPDAFVRRCLVLQIELPSGREALIALLMSRGAANVEGCQPEVLRRTAEILADDRAELQGTGVCLPGVAEYVDLLRVVVESARNVEAQLALLEEVKRLATRKHPRERGG